MINYFYLKFILLAFAVSTHCLACDAVRDLEGMNRINGDRCDLFNSDSSEVLVGEITKTKDDAIADYTDSINTFLTDKKNVNPKRHATQDQQRDILQSLMATAIVYGPTTTYADHGLAEGDALFWHFEILRAAEHLSGLYVLQLLDNRSNRCYSDEWYNDYKILSSRGNITGTMFHRWFAETIAWHGDGLRLQKSISLPSILHAEKYVENNGTIISGAIAYVFSNDTKPITKMKCEALIKAIHDAETRAIENAEPNHEWATTEQYNQYADELDRIRGQLQSLSQAVKRENGFIHKKEKKNHRKKGPFAMVSKIIDSSTAQVEIALFKDFDSAIEKISSAQVVDAVELAPKSDTAKRARESIQDILIEYGYKLKEKADFLRTEEGISFSKVSIGFLTGYQYLEMCISELKNAVLPFQ